MNHGSDSILSVYSDARAEYTKQLCVYLVPAYFQFYIDLLEKAKQLSIQEPKKSLWHFQNLLNDIHDWNNEKVNHEIHTIHTNCGCDYLEDLLTAVFIAHTKVLTAIRINTTNKKIDINVPKVEHFLFKVLCETSKLLWSSTYLFREGIPPIEKQQNYRTIEGLLNEGIVQAVRSLVPVKTILKDFMYGSSSKESQEESDSDTEQEASSSEKEAVKEESIPAEIKESIQEPTSATTELESSTPVPEQKEAVPSTTVDPSLPPSIQNEERVSPSTPTIVLDEKPNVRFGNFDAVFNMDHPNQSDMIYDAREEDITEEEEYPELEITDEISPLSEGIDYEDLDDSENKFKPIEENDYEEL
jgi:hypothetical protein